MARATSTLSVRIDPDVLTKLIEYTNNRRGVTQAKVVESLIKYFARQSPEQQHLIVMGVGSDYLALLGKALQLVTWGDHAYNGRFLPWVIETFGELDRISAEAQESANDEEPTSDPVGLLSLRRIAWFKLGSAWMDLAMELRARALADLARHLDDAASKTNDSTPDAPKTNEWHEHYAAALESLRVAIAYHRFFNKSLEMAQPTVLYNQACAWTLIAQYITERNASNQELGPLAQRELYRQEEEEKKLKEEQILQKSLPLPHNGEADDALEQATGCLQSIKIHYQGHTEGMPLADTQWLFDYAERDFDLSFFRRGRGDDFQRWLDERKSRTSILDSFKRLRYGLPKEVAKEVGDIVVSERS